MIAGIFLCLLAALTAWTIFAQPEKAFVESVSHIPVSDLDTEMKRQSDVNPFAFVRTVVPMIALGFLQSWVAPILAIFALFSGFASPLPSVVFFGFLAIGLIWKNERKKHVDTNKSLTTDQRAETQETCDILMLAHPIYEFYLAAVCFQLLG